MGSGIKYVIPYFSTKITKEAVDFHNPICLTDESRCMVSLKR